MLDEATYALLGRISVQAGWCEASMRRLQYELDGDDPIAARGRDARVASFDTAAEVAKASAKVSSLSPELVASILDAIAVAKSAIDLRDQIVHSAWVAAGVQRHHRRDGRWLQQVGPVRLGNALERLRRASDGLDVAWEQVIIALRRWDTSTESNFPDRYSDDTQPRPDASRPLPQVRSVSALLVGEGSLGPQPDALKPEA